VFATVRVVAGSGGAPDCRRSWGSVRRAWCPHNRDRTCTRTSRSRRVGRRRRQILVAAFAIGAQFKHLSPRSANRPSHRSHRDHSSGLMRPHARIIDESAARRYMRRHDRDAHSYKAPPWPLSGRGGRARLIVTCGRGSRGAFSPEIRRGIRFSRRHLLRRGLGHVQAG